MLEKNSSREGRVEPCNKQYLTRTLTCRSKQNISNYETTSTKENEAGRNSWAQCDRKYDGRKGGVTSSLLPSLLPFCATVPCVMKERQRGNCVTVIHPRPLEMKDSGISHAE